MVTEGPGAGGGRVTCFLELESAALNLVHICERVALSNFKVVFGWHIERKLTVKFEPELRPEADFVRNYLADEVTVYVLCAGVGFIMVFHKFHDSRIDRTGHLRVTCSRVYESTVIESISSLKYISICHKVTRRSTKHLYTS